MSESTAAPLRAQIAAQERIVQVATFAVEECLAQLDWWCGEIDRLVATVEANATALRQRWPTDPSRSIRSA